ncbi:lipase member H-like [Photinus pyralis]|nr:lipase member H-like [Photinus pyralis]
MNQASPSRPTVIIAHGWQQSSNSVWVIEAKNTHLSTADKNIITLDWSKDAVTLDYPQAAGAVPLVGAYLAKQFHQWVVLKLINADTSRFVGFSLGAQVIGICGQEYQNLTGGQKLKFLIALEPAAPLFEGKPIAERLDKTDGDLVHVFHTSKTGMTERCGHVDVYFSYSEIIFFIFQIQNCGVEQLGCPTETGLPADKAGLQTILCDHVRAPAYYIISITSSNFLAALCTSCDQFKRNGCNISAPIVVGDRLDPATGDGAYYLTTLGKLPFAKGIAGLQM